jgi:hypothetical protein
MSTQINHADGIKKFIKVKKRRKIGFQQLHVSDSGLSENRSEDPEPSIATCALPSPFQMMTAKNGLDTKSRTMPYLGLMAKIDVI